MNIDIQARGFDTTDAIRDYARRRLQFAINWTGSNVRAVNVTLSDLNGPKGGQDKCCAIRLQITGEPSVLIADKESDLYTAIDRAAERCKSLLARRIARRHDRANAGVSLGRMLGGELRS
jgi:putative sigma-54 modulation protein